MQVLHRCSIQSIKKKGKKECSLLLTLSYQDCVFNFILWIMNKTIANMHWLRNEQIVCIPSTVLLHWFSEIACSLSCIQVINIINEFLGIAGEKHIFFLCTRMMAPAFILIMLACMAWCFFFLSLWQPSAFVLSLPCLLPLFLACCGLFATRWMVWREHISYEACHHYDYACNGLFLIK